MDGPSFDRGAGDPVSPPDPGLAAEDPAPEHERTSRFALRGFEARVLPWLAERLPARVTPDHMTVLGVLASLGVAVTYVLSNRSPAWLWAASGFLVVQWLGDSLDGTLARHRRIERPRYGFYLDHLVDAFSTFAIGLGLGLSPYMLLSVGLAIVVAYHLLSINVYLETYVYGEFSFGYAWLGPTEARLVLIGLNTLALTVGPLPFGIAGAGATVFDLAGGIAALAMLGLLGARVVANLRRLSRLEPAGRRVTETGAGG